MNQKKYWNQIQGIDYQVETVTIIIHLQVSKSVWLLLDLFDVLVGLSFLVGVRFSCLVVWEP
jgi:hypothetical protein